MRFSIVQALFHTRLGPKAPIHYGYSFLENAPSAEPSDLATAVVAVGAAWRDSDKRRYNPAARLKAPGNNVSRVNFVAITGDRARQETASQNIFPASP